MGFLERRSHTVLDGTAGWSVRDTKAEGQVGSVQHHGRTETRALVRRSSKQVFGMNLSLKCVSPQRKHEQLSGEDAPLSPWHWLVVRRGEPVLSP